MTYFWRKLRQSAVIKDFSTLAEEPGLLFTCGLHAASRRLHFLRVSGVQPDSIVLALQRKGPSLMLLPESMLLEGIGCYVQA